MCATDNAGRGYTCMGIAWWYNNYATCRNFTFISGSGRFTQCQTHKMFVK
jgi:hypothetical protein